MLIGFLPPLRYSIYENNNAPVKDTEHSVINDYGRALQLAKQQHKPLLIDFTGWACVNCRRMEEQVWTKPDVSRLINSEFIIVSLYVDDRKKLPVDQRFSYTTKEGNEKDILTFGDKWATFQAENFFQVSQPMYALISPEETLLNNPVGYEPDAKKYLEWLECGLEVMKNK